MNVAIAASFAANTVTCSNCSIERCKNYQTFERSKEILLGSGDEISKQYVANFINDYLGVSEVTVSFFNIKVSEDVKEKKKDIYVVTSYQKSQKK